MGQEDPQEEGVAPHSSIFAWIIPWTEKLASYIQSMELHTIAKRRLSTHVETTFYLSIQPSLDIWLLWIILVNRGIQIPVLVLAFNSLGDISRTGIARSDDNFSVLFFFFFFFMNCHTVFHIGCTNLYLGEEERQQNILNASWSSFWDYTARLHPPFQRPIPELVYVSPPLPAKFVFNL